MKYHRLLRSISRRSYRTLASLFIFVFVLAAPGAAYAETVREFQQWYLDAVSVLPAQQITKGEGVVVAVIDSGVEASHPDLAGAVLPGASFLGSTSKDGHTDPTGHGTKMSALIAARGGGANNALGIAPAAKILPIAIPAKGSNSYVGSLAEPIYWAVDHGAQIINLALARPDNSDLPKGEAEAIAYAQSKGVIVVVAAGNLQQTDSNELAYLPGVVVASGTNRSGTVWSGSAQGDFVSIAAPGVGIVNASARNVHATGYNTSDGTSESAAIISGVLALIKSMHPEFSAANVINQLLQTATDKGTPGRDPAYGFGLVNAYKAVTATVPSVTTNPLGVAEDDTKTDASKDTDANSAANTKKTASTTTEVLSILGPLCLLGLIGWLVWRHVARARRAKLAGPGNGTPPYTTPPPAPPVTPQSPYPPA